MEMMPRLEPTPIGAGEDNSVPIFIVDDRKPTHSSQISSIVMRVKVDAF